MTREESTGSGMKNRIEQFACFWSLNVCKMLTLGNTEKFL